MLFGSHDDSESHVMLLNWSQRSSRVTLLLVLTGQALMTHACVLAILLSLKDLAILWMIILLGYYYLIVYTLYIQYAWIISSTVVSPTKRTTYFHITKPTFVYKCFYYGSALFSPIWSMNVPSTLWHCIGLLKRTLSLFTPNLSFKNDSVLLNRPKIQNENFHQSWGFGFRQ